MHNPEGIRPRPRGRDGKVHVIAFQRIVANANGRIENFARSKRTTRAKVG